MPLQAPVASRSTTGGRRGAELVDRQRIAASTPTRREEAVALSTFSSPEAVSTPHEIPAEIDVERGEDQRPQPSARSSARFAGSAGRGNTRKISARPASGETSVLDLVPAAEARV